MLRIWCEHLDYGEARRPETLDLLESGRLHPIFALRPDSSIEQLARLVRAVDDRGLEVGIWPLLEKHDGYWPSVRNAATFCDHVEASVGQLQKHGVAPSWVAFDIEPPFESEDTLGSSMRRTMWRGLGHLVGQSGEPADGPPADRAFGRALETYQACLDCLSASGIATLGVTALPVAADLDEDLHWQRVLETPWSPLDWDRAGFMAYGSMIAALTRGILDYADVRALHYTLFQRLRRSLGQRAHVSLGVTGTGVFGDEPAYQRAEELALDVAAARAAGVDDIAIFCLEGVLKKARPGEWVDAVAEAAARVPAASWRAESVLLGSSMVTRLLATLFKINRVGS